MGWYTYVPNVEWFCKETFNDISDVEEEIKKCDEFIAEAKNKLMLLAALHPKDLLQKDCENNDLDITSSIQSVVNETLEWLEENILRKDKLEILKENFDCRRGDFIKNPKYKENFQKWLKEKKLLN